MHGTKRSEIEHTLPNDQHAHEHDGVRVIKGDRLDPNTAQTPGMFRQAAINHARVGAQKIWAGTVSVQPNAKTGVHHHGESESAIYVVRGRVTFFTGEGLRERIVAEAGDFLFVPPNSLHVEANFGDEDAELIVARSTQEGIVVNRDDLSVPEDVLAQARA